MFPPRRAEQELTIKARRRCVDLDIDASADGVFHLAVLRVPCPGREANRLRCYVLCSPYRGHVGLDVNDGVNAVSDSYPIRRQASKSSSGLTTGQGTSST